MVQPSQFTLGLLLVALRGANTFAPPRLPSTMKIRPVPTTTSSLSLNVFIQGKESAATKSTKASASTTSDGSFSQPFWERQGGGKIDRTAACSHSSASWSTENLSNLLSADESSSAPVPVGIEEQTRELDLKQLALPVVALLLGAVGVGAAAQSNFELQDVVAFAQNFFANPQATLQNVIDSVQAMGPLAPVYFGILYCIAEVLAVPATPLTLSAGYLFGVTQGAAVVLLAATVAASIAFFVGKTFLRSWVEEMLQENPKIAKLDKAVGEQGFKLLVLLRLSPIFPFALSNYLYGASAISFQDYFWATLLGFTPGTIGYVYTGMVGKELMFGDGGQPWYLYASGFAVLGVFLKLVTDVAGGIVEAIDDDNEDDQTLASP